MSLTYKGNVTFDDAMEPRAGKSDWGIDTLMRRVKGASTLLEAYLATLTQGATYVYNGVPYYLQTWEPDDDPVFATVSLSYKGLKAGIPAPDASDETCINTTSISADITSLNIQNSDGTVAKSATRDIEFWCPQTTWRYITSGRPSSPSYGTIANGRGTEVIRSVITLDNGQRYTGNAPAGLVSVLSVGPSNKITGPHTSQIHGTPYFECQDLVQRGYWT